MKKVIRITESELIEIVNKIIIEQSTNQTTSKVLPCVPEAFKLSTQTLIDKKYNKLFIKSALGIIGRESDFGESNRFKFLSPLKTVFAAFGGQSSIGYAQIKPETAEKYGMGIRELNMALGSLIGAYKILVENYNRAIKVGYTTENPPNFKDSTGNAALDMAIAGFNLGPSKIVKYCKTSNPNIKRPCSLAGKTIKEQAGSAEMAIDRRNYQQIKDNSPSLTVTNEEVKNYIPNFKTERWDGVKITTHGYVKEVSNRIRGFNCF